MNSFPSESDFEMYPISLRRLSRLSALVLIALLVVGCSVDDPATSQDKVYDQARDLGQSLSEASAATQDANTGFADPGFAARAIERAASESRTLASIATQVEAPPIRNLTADMVTVADRAIMALSSGDVQQAERIRTTEFVPLASQLADLKRTLPASASATEPSSIGSSLTISVFVVAAIVAGALMYLRGRAKAVAAGEKAEPGTTTSSQRSPHDADQLRAWDAPNPLYGPPPSEEYSAPDDSDAYRSTKVRPIDVELRELLESTLEQVGDRGWDVDVTLVYPVVHISGDPIRVQRAVLAALGNVYLGGPGRVGIIVEEEDGRVKLSIGHDAPMDEATTEDLAVRLANQLELALATLDLTWTVAYDDEISLITIALGASLPVSSEAPATV